MSKLPSTENDVKAIVKKWFDDYHGFSFAPPPSRGMGVHGIGDRLGVMPIVVTQAMVGKTVGMFVAVEAKKPGRRGEKLGGATKAQEKFLSDVLDAGGVAALVDSAPDMQALTETLADLVTDGDVANLTMRERLDERTSGNG